jgi:hypothetical protein
MIVKRQISPRTELDADMPVYYKKSVPAEDNRQQVSQTPEL